jgi:UDP-glucose 4-epimerase
VAEEDLLDAFELEQAESDQPNRGPRIARLRPGLIGQHDAGTAVARQVLPSYIPTSAAGWLSARLPALPLDRALQVPVAHSDDIADAIVRVLDRRATGPFNLAAEEPLTSELLGSVLGARPVHVPAAALSALVNVGWHLRMSALPGSWIDMAYAVPMLDCTRAHDKLGWIPRHSAAAVLRDLVAGIRNGSSSGGAVLGSRSALAPLRKLAAAGPITTRRLQ